MCPDCVGTTPLWYASYYGHQEVVEWLIASGRGLGDQKKVTWYRKNLSALEIARKKRHRELVSLLERLMVNPTQTRCEIRMKLDVLDELAAELYALIVFLCDDLLQLKPVLATSSNPTAAAALFFAISSKLPMELQMVLCHRVVGSVKHILLKDSEAAFKSLASVLLISSQIPFR